MILDNKKGLGGVSLKRNQKRNKRLKMDHLRQYFPLKAMVEKDQPLLPDPKANIHGKETLSWKTNGKASRTRQSERCYPVTR